MRTSPFGAPAALVALLLAPASAWTAQPRIFFSDLDSGPNSGGQNNAGAFVTIYGKRFGATRGTSFVTIGGGQAVAYPIWTDAKITFQLGPAAATGNIVVTTPGGTSNGLPFTVRAGKIYFVAATGSNANDGSLESPWQTLPKARDTIQPGDTVYAMDGVSQTADDGSGWRAAMLFRTGGSPGAPKALVAYPGATVTIGSVTGPSFGIRTTGSPGNWTLAGLVLRGGNVALGISGGGHSNWRIVGNDMSCPNGTGAGACFETSQISYVKLFGNNIHHTGQVNASALYHGVYFSTDSNHLDVGWNTIANVRGCRGLQVHSTVLMAGAGHNQYDISIHDNVIHDTQCDGIILSTVDPSQGRVEVYNNIIYNAGQGPNNPERSGGWSCINVMGHTNAGPAGGGTVEVYNNTLYNCGTFATPPYSDVRSGVLNGGRNPSLRIRIRNNIMYLPDGVPYVTIWTPTRLCADIENCPGIYGSNNLFFGSGRPPSNTNITRSLNSDPLFVNLAQHDFHLSSRSPALRAGVDTGATTDKDGLARGGSFGYDLGALQFVKLGVASFVCSSPVIFTPGSTWCEVWLNGEAPAGGVELAMTSEDPRLRPAARVVVPAGLSSLRFQVDATIVGARTKAKVSAGVSDSIQTAELWLLPPGDTAPALLAVVDAASFAPGPVAPGGIATAFGTNLGPETTVGPRVEDGRVQSSLAGVTAYFDDTPAPLLFVQANQLNAVVPFSMAGRSSVLIEIDVAGQRSNPLSVRVAPTAPGVFTAAASGQGQALALNEDGSLNSSSKPARKTSIIVFYAAGLGQTEPPGVDGLLAGDPLPRPTSSISAHIGGLDAELLNAGGAPNLVAGLYQINARIPEGVSSGQAVPLVLRAGSAVSQPGVTIAIE